MALLLLNLQKTFKWIHVDVSLCWFLWITILLKHVAWKGFLRHVAFVVTSFDKFNGFSIGSLISLVNTHNPTLRSKGFSEVVQFKVFVSRICISNIIITFGFSILSIDLPGTIVTEFIHKTVLHRGKDHIINSVSISWYIVFFLDMRINTSTDSDHPQEFVDIITWVSTDSSIDDQNIVNIKSITNFESFVLRRTHSQTHSSNVSIVPGVIIN